MEHRRRCPRFRKPRLLTIARRSGAGREVKRVPREDYLASIVLDRSDWYPVPKKLWRRQNKKGVNRA